MAHDPALVEYAIESFAWESQAQKEGFLALCKYWHDNGVELILPLQQWQQLSTIFLIQKMYEADLHWNEAVGTQISNLQGAIRNNQECIAALRRELDQFRETSKAQNILLEKLTRDVGSKRTR